MTSITSEMASFSTFSLVMKLLTSKVKFCQVMGGTSQELPRTPRRKSSRMRIQQSSSPLMRKRSLTSMMTLRSQLKRFIPTNSPSTLSQDTLMTKMT